MNIDPKMRETQTRERERLEVMKPAQIKTFGRRRLSLASLTVCLFLDFRLAKERNRMPLERVVANERLESHLDRSAKRDSKIEFILLRLL